MKKKKNPFGGLIFVFLNLTQRTQLYCENIKAFPILTFILKFETAMVPYHQSSFRKVSHTLRLISAAHFQIQYFSYLIILSQHLRSVMTIFLNKCILKCSTSGKKKYFYDVYTIKKSFICIVFCCMTQHWLSNDKA